MTDLQFNFFSAYKENSGFFQKILKVQKSKKQQPMPSILPVEGCQVKGCIFG